jgi:tRNA threonylcarbamoyl adenosine modification protein YeaZ
MMILAIDTSTDSYEFALFWPDKISKEFSAKREDKKDALFYIDQFLKKNKVDLKDLKAIAVFKGPGSFTGLRVGISIANTLAWVLKIPVIGFSGEKYQGDALKIARKGFEKLEKKKVKARDFIIPRY